MRDIATGGAHRHPAPAHPEERTVICVLTHDVPVLELAIDR